MDKFTDSLKKLGTSLAELVVYHALLKRFSDSVWQYDCIFSNDMHLDVYIPQLKTAIEYDGGKWHTGIEAEKRDRKKYGICHEHGITLYRISEKERESDRICDRMFLRKDNHAAALVDAINGVLAHLGCTDMTDTDELSELDNTVRAKWTVDLCGQSLEIKRPDIAKLWLEKENGGLTANQITPGATTNKYRFICTECGKPFLQYPYLMCKGYTKCGVCSGKKAGPDNNIAVTHPEIMQMWDYDANGKRKPEDYLPYSNGRVHLICELGHRYQQSVAHFTQGIGCPYCNGKKVLKGFNDLETKYPDLAEHVSRDSPVKPSEVFPNTSTKLLWACVKCKKEFWCGGNDMTQRHNKGRPVLCSSCAPSNAKVSPGVNDLATEHPDVAAEWDYAKNETLPSDYTSRSGASVYWKCPNCGRSYPARIAERVGNGKRKGTQCPYCGKGHKRVCKGVNDLQSQYPMIAAEYDIEKNEKAPDEISAHAGIKAWWHCKTCGKRWQEKVSNRTRGKDGPHCKCT